MLIKRVKNLGNWEASLKEGLAVVPGKMIPRFSLFG